MKLCERCNKPHDGSYGSGRFCCKSCSKSFIAKQVKNHKNNLPTNKIDYLDKLHTTNLKEKRWQCSHCGECFKTRKLLGQHTKEKHASFYENGKRLIWNKGLTAANDERIAKISKKLSIINTGRFLTLETRSKISKTMKERGHGGLRAGAGRGIRGWYKGYYFDSSWELAYIVYNIDNGIKFKRNTESFEYIFNNEVKKYYPDFILSTGEYIEIKGYYSKRYLAKMEAFPKDKKLIIYDKTNISQYLNYAIGKYGKTFYLDLNEKK